MIGVNTRETDYIYKRLLERLLKRGTKAYQGASGSGSHGIPPSDHSGDEEEREVFFDVLSFDNSFQKIVNDEQD